MDNLETKGKFQEMYNLPRLNQQEIENKSRLNYSVLVRKPDNNTEIIKGVWNNE